MFNLPIEILDHIVSYINDSYRRLFSMTCKTFYERYKDNKLNIEELLISSMPLDFLVINNMPTDVNHFIAAIKYDRMDYIHYLDSKTDKDLILIRRACKYKRIEILKFLIDNHYKLDMTTLMKLHKKGYISFDLLVKLNTLCLFQGS